MEFVSLAGTKVPALGLGTWLLEGADCRRAVPQALDLGYRHIDTAQIYGNEAEIGDAIAGAEIDRDELFITTKVWNDRHAAADVVASTEESLRRLRCDHVDLLLVHWPVAFDRIGETLGAMQDLVDRELVRHIGVSNFTVEQFVQAAALAPVACNQVEYHPFLDQGPVLEAARRAGAVLTAYSPLARGKVFRDRTLAAIGERHGKSAAQVALRWLLDQEAVLAVPKATSRDHLAANLEVFDFTLSDEDRRSIDALARSERLVEPPFAPDWED